MAYNSVFEEYYVDFNELDFDEDDEFSDALPPEPEYDDEDDDDEQLYCLCKMPETGDMIECEGENCTMKWFHYDCVGLTANNIPKGSWFCNSCKPGSTSSSTQGTRVNGAQQANARKTQSKKRKGPPRRPANIYNKESAMEDSIKFVSDALQGVPEHDCFIKPFANALLVVALASSLLASAESEAFKDFCLYFLTNLWNVVTAGDSKPLQYAEILVIQFHAFRIKPELTRKWDSLLDVFELYPELVVSDLLLQHLLDIVLESLLCKRNAIDNPELERAIASEKMNKDEEKVLAYVAGYIPFALKKHYSVVKDNITASKFVTVLKSWGCSGPYDQQYSFLKYTNDWIAMQSRGGLFEPNAQVFIFFRALENETRKHLSTENIGKFRDISLRDLLLNFLTKSKLIQTYWTKITGSELTPAESCILFKAVIKYWIKIRCRAFVLVYVDIRKLNEELSKKGDKALRKQLKALRQKEGPAS